MAAFDIIDSAADIVAGGDMQISPAEFDERCGGWSALGRAGIGGNRRANIFHVMASLESHIAPTERTDILKEIAEIHPPTGGGRRIGGGGETGADEDASKIPIRAEQPSPVEPVVGKLSGGIVDKSRIIQRLSLDVLKRVDGNVPSGHAVLSRIGLLGRSEIPL